MEFLTGPLPRTSKRDPQLARRGAEAAGLVVDDLRVERPEIVFFDVGAVVYFLRVVVWTIPDFTVDRYRERLRALHDQIERERRVSHDVEPVPYRGLQARMTAARDAPFSAMLTTRRCHLGRTLGILLGAVRRSARTSQHGALLVTAAALHDQTVDVDDLPDTRYAKTTDGAHLAYQVVGEGPLDLAFVRNGGGNVDAEWEMPAYARVLPRLASFSRVIRFDPRGRGLSDPLGLGEQPAFEDQAKDMLAVLDAADSERAAVLANGPGGLLALFFAASYPTRTSSLVLDGCYARLAQAEDYPWGVPTEILDAAIARLGKPATTDPADSLAYFAPSAMKDAQFVAQWRRLSRSASSPAVVRAISAMWVYGDVRSVLASIQAPTLILYRDRDQFAGQPHATYLAEQIADAKLVELRGKDNLIYLGDSDATVDEIEEFLTGARHAPDTNRVLATVLFTDIVASTERAAELGDARWRELLDAHDAVIRRQLERFRGREVNTAGDGFLATFDGPGRAIECACAIRDAVRALDIEVRAGLHTGEIEVRGADVAGMAVHIGARIASLAGDGEVVVSSTVKDLVVGSGIEFAERGDHELKGVPGSWSCSLSSPEPALAFLLADGPTKHGRSRAKRRYPRWSILSTRAIWSC